MFLTANIFTAPCTTRYWHTSQREDFYRNALPRNDQTERKITQNICSTIKPLSHILEHFSVTFITILNHVAAFTFTLTVCCFWRKSPQGYSVELYDKSISCFNNKAGFIISCFSAAYVHLLYYKTVVIRLQKSMAPNRKQPHRAFQTETIRR